MTANFLSKYFNEIEIGERYVSRGRTVTESDLVGWCSLTGDWYRLHSDAHYAAGTRFGQRVAHGLLVHAIATGLAVPPDAPAIIANYGTDQLRFLAPTFIGDTIHLEAAVQDKTVKHTGRDGIVKLAWNVVNQNGVTVLVSDLLILMAWAQEVRHG